MSEQYSGLIPLRYNHDQVSLAVTWRWEAHSNLYWLDHKTWDESTEEVLDHGSNGFRWKPLDATGDAALAVRWIHKSREWLVK